MRKLLRVDMSDLSVKSEPLPERFADYGGRALTSAIVFEEVPATAHPLGEHNKLVIAPGLLGGTTAPASGRVSVGAKSPLTGGIKESNSGGMVGITLGRLGIGAIVIEGLPKEKDAAYALVIEADGSTKLERHDEWKGKTNYDLADVIKAARPDDDRFATLTIGPAGEFKLSAATVACTDSKGLPNRHAGRGGMGAVMGSKGLKAIIASDKGLARVAPADKDRFGEATKAMTKASGEHPVTSEGLPTYGTNVLVNIINEAGGFPTRNFSAGQFEFAEALSGENMRERTIERGGDVKHGCHAGCPIQCSRYYADKDGHYKTKGPEYETVWAMGANCGLEDLDDVADLDRTCGDLGLDTIEMGATLAVYMDAGQIAFGDAAAALATLREAGTGSALGRLIGSGTEVVGKAFGVTRVPTVKHQAMPAYDPRPIQGIGVTYATTTMGADHTAGYAITANVLGVGGHVNPLGPEGQMELSRNLQIATAMLDAMGFCIFVAFPVLDIPEAFQSIVDMVSAQTGREWTADDLLGLGKKVLTYERLFNQRAGFSAADDRLPEFMYTEPLPPHGSVFQVTDAELDSVFDFVPETAAQLGIQA